MTRMMKLFLCALGVFLAVAVIGANGYCVDEEAGLSEEEAMLGLGSASPDETLQVNLFSYDGQGVLVSSGTAKATGTYKWDAQRKMRTCFGEPKDCVATLKVHGDKYFVGAWVRGSYSYNSVGNRWTCNGEATDCYVIIRRLP